MMMMMINYANDADNLNNDFNTDNLDHREGNCSIHEHNSLILSLPTYLPTYMSHHRYSTVHQLGDSIHSSSPTAFDLHCINSSLFDEAQCIQMSFFEVYYYYYYYYYYYHHYNYYFL